jgi:hypothetical protein
MIKLLLTNSNTLLKLNYYEKSIVDKCKYFINICQQYFFHNNLVLIKLWLVNLNILLNQIIMIKLILTKLTILLKIDKYYRTIKLNYYVE